MCLLHTTLCQHEEHIVISTTDTGCRELHAQQQQGSVYQKNVGPRVNMGLRGASSCYSQVVATHKGQGGHAALLLMPAVNLHLPAACLKASSDGLQASPHK